MPRSKSRIRSGAWQLGGTAHEVASHAVRADGGTLGISAQRWANILE